jgi:hypothetical protein
MTGKTKQRIDADNAFLRVQNRASVQARIMSETELLEQARDAKTANLKAQRLEKEAADRLTPTSRLTKSKG